MSEVLSGSTHPDSLYVLIHLSVVAPFGAKSFHYLSQTSYFPAVAFYYALNRIFPHYASLVAEAVTADDVDMSVPTDDGHKTEFDDSKETYEMTGVPALSQQA